MSVFFVEVPFVLWNGPFLGVGTREWSGFLVFYRGRRKYREPLSTFEIALNTTTNAHRLTAVTNILPLQI